MIFKIFRKKDPICGMKEEKGKGLIDIKTGKWFCSKDCKNKYYDLIKKHSKNYKSCCH